MLVLRRKQAETVIVDGRIQITVLQIKRNAISLGIQAPDGIAIWRGELEPRPAPDSDAEADFAEAGLCTSGMSR